MIEMFVWASLPTGDRTTAPIAEAAAGREASRCPASYSWPFNFSAGSASDAWANA
jgi:hypothetical protein